LKEEALDRTLWKTGFGRGYGPAERHHTMRSLWWYEQQYAIPVADNRIDWLLAVFDFIRSWKSCIQSRVPRLLWNMKIHCRTHKSLVKFCTPRGRSGSYVRLEIWSEFSIVRR